MTTIYELDGRYFETREQAESAEDAAYYTYFPIKEHETEYTWVEWSMRFDFAREQGDSISGATHFAFSKLPMVITA